MSSANKLNTILKIKKSCLTETMTAHWVPDREKNAVAQDLRHNSGFKEEFGFLSCAFPLPPGGLLTAAAGLVNSEIATEVQGTKQR